MPATKRKPETSPDNPDNLRAEGVLNLLSEPGAIQIEAAADGMEADGKPRLPRFSMVAYTGGLMRIAGWRHPVVVDLGGLEIPSQSRPIRFGHDMASGVGHTNSIRVEEGRLLAAGVVSRDTAAAHEIVVSAANGFPWQASIGASVEEFEFVKAQQKTIVNGREFTGPVNVIRKALLGEISFVDLGADGQTSASVLAAANALTQENDGMDENEVTNTEGQQDATATGGAQATANATAAGNSTATGAVTATADQTNGVQAGASITEQAVAGPGRSPADHPHPGDLCGRPCTDRSPGDPRRLGRGPLCPGSLAGQSPQGAGGAFP